MVLGVVLGNFVPGISEALGFAHIADVSLPIALGLWLMMWCVEWWGCTGLLLRIC